jgi:hypothetical protein
VGLALLPRIHRRDPGPGHGHQQGVPGGPGVAPGRGHGQPAGAGDAGGAGAAFATGWISNLELTYPGADWDYNILEGPGLGLPEHASLAELAEARREAPLDLALDLILRALGPILVSRVIAPEDVRAVLGSSLVMTGTTRSRGGRPGPREVAA